MAEEALNLIKKAESDALKKIDDAKILAQEMIENAKKDVKEKEEALRGELKKEDEKAKNAALQLAKEKARAVIDASVSESERISKNTGKKIDSVYALILDKIAE